MKIIVSKNTKQLDNGQNLITYNISPEKTAYRLALNAIHDWRNLKDLVKFALSGHGYGNSDSGCGITYESDLDDYDKEVEKVSIPIGYVQAYSDHFDVQEKNLTETEYLLILKAYCETNNEMDFANSLIAKINQKPQ